LRDLDAALPPARFAEGALLGLEGERAVFLVSIERISGDELNQLITGNWPGTGGTGASALQMPDSLESAMELATQATSQMAAGLQRVFARLWSFAWGDQATAHYLAEMDRLLQSSRTAIAGGRKPCSPRAWPSPGGERVDRRARTLYTQGILPASGRPKGCGDAQRVVADGHRPAAPAPSPWRTPR
jgi:hypothetical protein